MITEHKVLNNIIEILFYNYLDLQYVRMVDKNVTWDLPSSINAGLK